jgi:CRP-like cAMP-binding protein
MVEVRTCTRPNQPSIEKVLELASLRIQVWTSYVRPLQRSFMLLSRPPITYRNRLLATLSAEAMKLVAPHLSLVDLPRSRTLKEANLVAEGAYFLEDGICSIVATMEDGMSVEVGLIGREGFVGTAAVLDAGLSPNRYFMQVPGYGYRIKAKVLRGLSDTCAPLRVNLLRSVQGLLVQTAQTAACNRLHDLEERLARWLLMCRDRVQSDQIFVTQEFLATMLGTRRSSVTVAAGMLQKSGLITITRGHVAILDHAGLADAACECYQVVHAEYVRLGLLEEGPMEFASASGIKVAVGGKR